MVKMCLVQKAQRELPVPKEMLVRMVEMVRLELVAAKARLDLQEQREQQETTQSMVRQARKVLQVLLVPLVFLGRMGRLVHQESGALMGRLEQMVCQAKLVRMGHLAKTQQASQS